MKSVIYFNEFNLIINVIVSIFLAVCYQVSFKYIRIWFSSST